MIERILATIGVVCILGGVGAIIYLIKSHGKRQDKSVAEAKLRLKEVYDEVKKSANKTLSESESDDMHSRGKGTRLD